ncbi:unnamed protein product [Albugo candida]|uniref:Uncharacterized protein n=1 Tax=Albugo candida TaxID=65357 RepID=A0A024FVX7_9STRA|nr:unnamed protein product [Albugo candida]|eukprot:CCI10819.1 unnamed protein product [Albugo candida]
MIISKGLSEKDKCRLIHKPALTRESSRTNFWRCQLDKTFSHSCKPNDPVVLEIDTCANINRSNKIGIQESIRKISHIDFRICGDDSVLEKTRQCLALRTRKVSTDTKRLSKSIKYLQDTTSATEKTEYIKLESSKCHNGSSYVIILGKSTNL